jgi:hypothetical protein
MSKKKRKTPDYYKQKRKKWYVIFQNHPELTFIVAGVVTFIIVLFFPWLTTNDALRQNLLSSTLEVFFLGLFVIIYNKLRERKETIKKHRGEIISYLPWTEPEATYRIIGLINALTRLNVTDIYLAEAHLKGANLYGAHLEGADLFKAHLEGADLVGAHLEGADLYGAHLEGADLFRAYLEGADLQGAHLEGADLRGVYVDILEWIEKLKELECTGVEEIEAKCFVSQEEEEGKVVFRIREKKQEGKDGKDNDNY